MFNPRKVYAPAEVDWSLFRPDALEHVQWLLRGQIEAGEIPGNLLGGCLVSWGDRSKVASVKGGRRQPVDLAPIAEPAEALRRSEDNVALAKVNLERAKSRLDDARLAEKVDRRALHEALRAVYAEGATAPALADAVGLSVPRINQIVAGGRG